MRWLTRETRFATILFRYKIGFYDLVMVGCALSIFILQHEVHAKLVVNIGFTTFDAIVLELKVTYVLCLNRHISGE